MLGHHPFSSAFTTAVVLVIACAPSLSDPVHPLECPLSVPDNAARPFAEALRNLPGDYRLIQVSWQPAPPRVGRGYLHLEVPDSLGRQAPCGFGRSKRDLIGWYRPDDSTQIEWRQILESRDPKSPGVVVRGASLRVGQQECVMDGAGDNLQITAVAHQGFWGYWVQDMGIAALMDTVTHRVVPVAAGFFCALREGH